MQINADFGLRAAVHNRAEDWRRSPMPGVERLMLDRIGDEVARATSLVRYAPGCDFTPHEHALGEEFLVLEGLFQDEHGHYPAGCYVRNPPGTSHRPRSDNGCTIFVKLRQFDPEDREAVSTVVADDAWSSSDSLSELPLHRNGREEVRLEHWPAGDPVAHAVPEGMEILVLKGGFREGGEDFAPWSWLRLPAGAQLDAKAGPDGALVWIKAGHLKGL